MLRHELQTLQTLVYQVCHSSLEILIFLGLIEIAISTVL